ncbi:MAG: hypothetical protein O3C49_08135 [Proteobacteria bacterium]|nr:hypothetical protein [Pseudomonadota bacterium]
MSLTETLMQVFPNSLVTGIAWVLLLSLVLYFTRGPAQRSISTLCRLLAEAMQMASDSILGTEARLTARNRDVLLAMGREAAERGIEREFERIEANVRREIAQCTALDRMMNETLTKMEEDHKQSQEVPPAPPGWAGVVQSISEVTGKGDAMVAGILEQIYSSLVKMQDQAITSYRTAVESRHEHLRKMAPEWRGLTQLVTQTKKNVTTLIGRSQTIDHHMEEYEQMVKKTDQAERTLAASALKQFFVSGLVMAIAVGGAFINFQLIARPMAEAVGANSVIGGFKVAEIAALVIILLETAMGLFLMESFRITRLFPMIGALPDNVRQRMIYATLSILFFFAFVEAGLAYMREILLEDELATAAALRGGAQATAAGGYMWITTTAQMVMGFVLPFALVFVAIPLESFVESARTVLATAMASLLRLLAAAFRVLSKAADATGKVLVDVYDITIFGPLWVESMFTSGGTVRPPKPVKSAKSGSGPSLGSNRPGETPSVTEAVS